MPVTTQLQSNLQANLPTNQTSPHGSNNSMLDAFDQNNELADPANDTIVLPKTHSVDFISSKINELALDSTLDLAKHPASKILNLPATHSFASVNEFCSTMATNGARIFHSLVRIIAYNVLTNEKIAEQYVEWEKVTQIEDKKKL